MSAYIIIIYTKINLEKDYQKIKQLLNEAVGMGCWTIDFLDIDNVLRVESEEDRSGVIQHLLETNDVESKIAAIYKNSSLVIG